MAKVKKKAARRPPAPDLAELEQRRDEATQRRMLARAKRIRALVRAIDRESQRAQGDLEIFATVVLKDAGYTVSRGDEFRKLLDENLDLRKQIADLEGYVSRLDPSVPVRVE